MQPEAPAVEKVPAEPRDLELGGGESKEVILKRTRKTRASTGAISGSRVGASRAYEKLLT